jgi:hypothetical protein
MENLFGPLLARSVASLGEFCAKNEQNQLCELKVCLQRVFHSFSVERVVIIASPSEITIKASNFGPHGNFGPLLARSVASLGEFCAKNEQNQLCKLKVCLQRSFHSFFC